MAEAELGRGVWLVDLELKHADAVVELGRYVEFLIRGDVALYAKRGVMCGDHGYVAVFAGAEFGVAVAWLGVCWSGGGGCCSAG